MHSTRRFHAKGAFRRLRRYFETRSLRYCAGLFAVLLGLVALAAPSPYCIETPGPTQDVLGELSGRSGGEVIAVEGADTYTDEGELLLTTVNASGVPGYPVSNIVALIGWFDPDTVVMPSEAVGRPPRSTPARASRRWTNPSRRRSTPRWRSCRTGAWMCRALTWRCMWKASAAPRPA